MKYDDRKYTYVSRKVFDRTVDNLKEINGRHKSMINGLKRQLKEIEAFLDSSPHGSAYQMWKMERKGK